MDDKYDAGDFERNPMKYRLFQAAQIARDIITNNGEQDMKAGTHVCIKYRCDAKNAMYRRTEPVYSIVGHDRDLYANNLMNFVL